MKINVDNLAINKKVNKLRLISLDFFNKEVFGLSLQTAFDTHTCFISSIQLYRPPTDDSQAVKKLCQV